MIGRKNGDVVAVFLNEDVDGEKLQRRTRVQIQSFCCIDGSSDEGKADPTRAVLFQHNE